MTYPELYEQIRERNHMADLVGMDVLRAVGASFNDVPLLLARIAELEKALNSNSEASGNCKPRRLDRAYIPYCLFNVSRLKLRAAWSFTVIRMAKGLAL